MSEQLPLYKVPLPGPEDKSAPVMVYLRNNICWGDVYVKQAVRVSTWLRTNAAPDVLTIYNPRVLITTNAGNRPIQLPELHIAATEVMAFHLIPPAKDPIDYDPNEPNRHMDPVTIITANFRMDGSIRLAGATTLAKYLEVTHETYTSIYDADISCPVIPQLGVMHVPFVLVRQSGSIFAVRLPLPVDPQQAPG